MGIKNSKSPADTKKLGRGIKNFDETVWQRIVCSVAFEVVYQKFSKTHSLQPILLNTGDRVIAEATTRDKNWGIGIDVGDPRAQKPCEWNGTNILGWALMEARSALQAKPGGSTTSTSATRET